MAANMSPELLKLLQDRDAQFYNKNGAGNYIQQDGRYYQPVYAGGKGGEDGHDDQGMLTGFHGYDQSWADGGNHQGEMGQRYNADGTFAKDYEWQDDQAMQNFLIPLMAAGAMYGFLPGGMGGSAGGAGAGAAGGATGFGSSSSLASGMGLGTSGVGTGAFGGFGTTGLGMTSPWGFTGGAGLGAGAAAGGAAAGAAGAAAAGGGGGGGAGLGAGGGAASGGGGILSSLGGSSNLLGIGSSILGGLLGGRGQENEQSSTRQWDSRLDPYLFGDGGLFNLTQQAMQRSQSPQRLAEADRIRQMGLGMFSTPAARNPFGGQ